MKVCLRCNTHFDDQTELCPEDSGQLVAVGDDPLIGQLAAGRYRVICAVGRGSMGIVYKAVQESTAREVALKLLRNFHETSEETIKRFKREAKTASSLKHPNVVTVIDFGFLEDGQPYIVTEFLGGLSLAQFLREHGAIPPAKSRSIIRQVCDAVAEAHRQKIIHRDLKPENIVLQGRDQGGRFVKVVDFGVAKLVDPSGSSGQLTVDGKVCGSPAYMSPEQCRGIDIDPRTDIYALGVVIFETLTGKRPFVADDLMALMFMHVNEPAPKLSSALASPDFTPELEAVVKKAMSKNPDDRQQTVEQLWDEFNAAVTGRKKKGTQGWIPFTPWDAPGVSHTDLRALELPESLTKVEEDYQLEKSVRRKRLRQLSKRTLWVKIAVIAILIGVTIAYMRDYRYKADLHDAGTLVTLGRPEDAVRLLEKHKQEGDLAPANVETLNEAYLEAGKKYAKKHRYVEAVDLWQRVSSKSKYYSESNSLIHRYRHRN